MRQTLLSFPSIPRKRSEAVAAAKFGSPRPAPELPVEIWDIVLEGLSTIALKTFRLVCQSWCRVGTDRLFRTIYLDSYEPSWKRLEQLAASKYARLATSIVWTPVILYGECLDGAFWRSKYPNLLRGLNHSESLHFHKLFRHIYAETRHHDLSLTKYTDSLQKEGLKNLVSCHQLIIADDSDIETKCVDEPFRRRIQTDPVLLRKPSVWGRCPQWWVECSENNEVFASALDIFRLIQRAPAISQIKISMWGRHVHSIFDNLSHHSLPEGLPRIGTFELQLKFCTVVNVELDHPSIRSVLDDAFTTLSNSRNFPNLQHLVIEPVYTDAGRDFMKFYKHLQEKERHYDETNDDTNDDVSDSMSSASCTSSVYSSVSALDQTSETLPEGLTRDFLVPYEANLRFTMKRSQQLISLTLYNVTLNTKALMAWLCNQSQLPEFCLILQLKGSTILHGSCPRTFLQVLAQLGVKLTYDARNTVWYKTDPLDVAIGQECIEWRFHTGHKIKENLYCAIEMGWEPELWTDDNYPGNVKPEQMPDRGTICVQNSPTVVFVHRPWTIKYIAEFTDENPYANTYVYCLVRDQDQKHIFEWFTGSEYNYRRARVVPGQSEIEAIVAARASKEVYDDEYDYAYSQYLMQEEFYEEQDQAALLVYENELLRRDVIDTTGEVLSASCGVALQE